MDINESKIEKLNKGISPINDECILKKMDDVNVKYVSSVKKEYEEADFIFIATNTDYNEVDEKFDLSSIESVMRSIDQNTTHSKVIIIKSTIALGYTDELQLRYPEHKIIFSPEFLREGHALHGNLNPDRIVIGSKDEIGIKIGELLSNNVDIEKDKLDIIYTNNREAEIIKLFANSYLALRVAFVNEMDSFCRKNNLNSNDIINGVGADARIGKDYFNPSFGYGGYCLPKDTWQLLSEFNRANLSGEIIRGVVDANASRKKFIVQQIVENTASECVIGIDRKSVV